MFEVIIKADCQVLEPSVAIHDYCAFILMYVWDVEVSVRLRVYLCVGPSVFYMLF